MPVMRGNRQAQRYPKKVLVNSRAPETSKDWFA
jgi:hypothetical protein